MSLIGATLATLHRGNAAAQSRWRNFYYRALGVKLNGYVWMREIEISRNWADITLEPNVALDRGVVLLCSGPARSDKLLIRSGTYINRYTILAAYQHLEVGQNCMIGPHCYITDMNHGTAGGQLVKQQAMDVKPVVLEDDVWLGAGVTVLPGVRIGQGTVVGAGSIVTKDLPENVVAVGTPAKVLRVRTVTEKF